jgi:hypothetical protein
MELNHQTSPDSFFMEVPNFASVSRAGNLSHAMGERNQVGIGLSDRPARLHCIKTTESHLIQGNGSCEAGPTSNCMGCFVTVNPLFMIH